MKRQERKEKKKKAEQEDIRMKYISPMYRAFLIINNILLVVLAALCIIPFIHILAVSFSDAASTSAGSVGLVPKGFQFDAYVKVLGDPTVYRAFGITLLRMVLGTAYSMIVTISAAYPLSFEKDQFPGRKLFVVFFFIAMIFSGGIIPYYILIKELNLINTIWALVIGGVPIGNVIILMNFFRTLPKELREAAEMDGAGHWHILFRIYLPLSKPALATLSMLCLIGHWNDWFGGLVYMRDMDMYPLQTYIYNAMQSTQSFTEAVSSDAVAPRQAVIAALIVISIIPVIAVFPILQKHIKTGMVIGSVKE